MTTPTDTTPTDTTPTPADPFAPAPVDALPSPSTSTPDTNPGAPSVATTSPTGLKSTTSDPASAPTPPAPTPGPTVDELATELAATRDRLDRLEAADAAPSVDVDALEVVREVEFDSYTGRSTTAVLLVVGKRTLEDGDERLSVLRIGALETCREVRREDVHTA